MEMIQQQQPKKHLSLRTIDEQPIGEKHLFEWASRITSIKISELSQFRDAIIVLRLFEIVWPHAIQFKELSIIEKCTTKNHYLNNWNIVAQLMDSIGLPMSVCDVRAILDMKFEPIYYFLVMLYFLSSLKTENDFSVDFMYPIPGELAEFLQSDKSISCLQYDSTDLNQSIGPNGQPQTDNFDMDSISEIKEQNTRSILNYDEESLAVLSKNLDYSEAIKPEKVIQTDLTQRKIDKMLEANIDLRSMLQNSQQTIEELKTGRSRLSESSVSIDQHNSSILWKNESNRMKGEILLSKMKYEIESLNRQISYLREEKEIVKNNFENKLRDIHTQHENELSYERERQYLTAAETIFSKLSQRINEQQDFKLQLKKLEDEISFEADQIHHVVDEDYSEELLRLRQIRVIQQDRIRNLEKENSQLNELVSDLKSECKEVQLKLVMLQKDVMTQKQSQDSSILLEQGSKFSEKELQYKNEIEQLRCSIQKFEQRPVVEEFETAQKISKMEVEIGRLKKTNDFLRSKKRRESSSEGSSVESSETSDRSDQDFNESEMEQIFGDILQYLRKSQQVVGTDMEEKFWKLSKWYDIAKLRLEDSKTLQQQTQMKLDHLYITFGQQEAEYLSKLTNTQHALETVTNASKMVHMKEVAELVVQIQLQREKISDMEEEAMKRLESYQNLQKFVSMEDSRRFTAMYHQSLSVRNQMRGYKIREQLWTSLIENQRKRIDSLQDKIHKGLKSGSIDPQSLLQDQREEQESEMEATRLLNELQVLTSKSVMEYEQHGGSTSINSSPSQPDSRDEVMLLVDQKCLVIQQQLSDSKQYNEQLLQHCHKLKQENEQLRMIHSSMKLDSERLSLSVQHLDRQVNELKQIQQQLRREKFECSEQARKQVDEYEAKVNLLTRQIKEKNILLASSAPSPISSSTLSGTAIPSSSMITLSFNNHQALDQKNI